MYYLKHFFNPDAVRDNLKPAEGDDGKTDRYNLGYVQNVLPGMPLAELLPISAPGPGQEARFCQNQPILPIGHNAVVDPNNPRRLLARSGGYVFYLNDKITVKTLLNVPHDVDFKVGNIFFVGDIAVHGSIRSGFIVHGGNVRVSGVVEGANVRAHKNLLIEGGVWGGRNSGIVHAGGKMKMDFLDKGEARGKDNIFINKSCLFSTVYAGNNLAVQGRLYGGSVAAYASVYAGESLGNKAAIPTVIRMGYDPLAMRKVVLLGKSIEERAQTIRHLTAIAGHLPPDTNDNTRRLQALKAENAAAEAEHKEMLRKSTSEEGIAERCRLLCPGTVFPGVEIFIGKSYAKITRQYESVQFRLVNGGIKAELLPRKK